MTFYHFRYITRFFLGSLWLLCAASSHAQTPHPANAVLEGDYTIANFVYDDGSIEALTQHYRTLGGPLLPAHQQRVLRWRALRGGQQGPLEVGGSEYIDQHFPLLDFIRAARVE
jgi:hypothetical protein